MTRAEVLAYARTLEFIPPCLHWGTCQACGTVVWVADFEGANSLPTAFVRHRCAVDGPPGAPGRMIGVVVHGGEYVFSNAERGDKAVCEPTPALIRIFGGTWRDSRASGYLMPTEVRILPGSGGTRITVETDEIDISALKWQGPARPYDPVALSEAMRRDREP